MPDLTQTILRQLHEINNTRMGMEMRLRDLDHEQSGVADVISCIEQFWLGARKLQEAYKRLTGEDLVH